MNSTMGHSLETERADQMPVPTNARFFVYENKTFIGESAFDQDFILIGKSRNADLILDHQAIADIHALVQVKQGQAFLVNKNIGNGLRLNGESIKESKLTAEDIIQIGPYSIVYRTGLPVEPSASQTAGFDGRITFFPKESKSGHSAAVGKSAPSSTGEYCVKLLNQYTSDDQRNRAASNLARLLKRKLSKVEPLLARPEFILKRNLDQSTAEKWIATLQKGGILSQVKRDGAETESYENAPLPHGTSLKGIHATVYESSGVEELTAPEPTIAAFRGGDTLDWLPVDEQDEDDEEIWEAPFSVKEKLAATSAKGHQILKAAHQVQIIKTMGDSVADMRFLEKGKRYFLKTSNGRICLAENRSEKKAFAYFTPDHDGYVTSQNGRRNRLSAFQSEEYLHRRRKHLYRLPISSGTVVTIREGRCRYDISLTDTLSSPHVADTVTPKTMGWRHWAYSAGAHLCLVMCMSIYFYFNAMAPKPQEPHFVKIDISTLQALEAKKLKKPEPKKETPPPPPPKPEPVKMAKKEPPKKASKQPPVQAAQSSKKVRKSAKVQQRSSHPKAGGGFGKGNIANRNVNQTGLLSILGKNTVPGPSEAIASVTNLDAVAVPGATEKNFTVGGIKGSLGGSKISVGSPGGGMLQTKGSKQVLRSAGIGGKGEVAALERGSIGQKQVKAMVTAKMTRTVKVEGGMSREMVKRVIDQHLSDITFCYESALAGNPSIMGRVIFEWKILMNGRVGEVRIVASSINSHEIHDCIKRAIKTWQFPKPVGAEVVVSYPFIFDLVAF